MKKGIILYRDNYGLKYAKWDERKLFETMDALIELFDSYVKVGAIDNYIEFFLNPLKYMVTKYQSIWNDYNGTIGTTQEIEFLRESGLRREDIIVLKTLFDEKFHDLGDLAPIINASSIKANINPEDFDIYCDDSLEKEYRILLSFIRAIKRFERAFPTQQRSKIKSFTNNLLDNNLTPNYSYFIKK
jgi:hypothetical protein